LAVRAALGTQVATFHGGGGHGLVCRRRNVEEERNAVGTRENE